MSTPAQSDTSAEQTVIAAQGPRELSQSHNHELTGPPVALPRRHRDASIISEAEAAETAASSMPSPAPAVTENRRQGKREPGNRLEKHREQLVNLFWVHDLPLKEVQAVMKRQHGLDVR